MVSKKRYEIFILYHTRLSLLLEVHYPRNHHRSDVAVVCVNDEETRCRAQHLHAQADNTVTANRSGRESKNARATDNLQIIP